MPEEILFTDEIVYNGGINESESANKIKDHQWVSANNVEPLPDGCRMRLGYTNENSAIIPAISISSETGTDGRVFIDGTSEAIAQSFTVPSSSTTIQAIEVRLRNASGDTATQDLTITIVNDSGGDPGTTIQATYTGFEADDLTADFKWFRSTLDTETSSLNSGTTYWVNIGQANPGASAQAEIEENTAGNPYANGTVSFAANPVVSWTAVSNADLNFRFFIGSATVTGIKDYALASGASEFHMVFAGSHLYKNVANVFTPVSQNPRLIEYVANKDTHPSMVVANDRFMLTDGTDPSQQFYLDSSVEYYENAGILAPTATPTLTPTAGSALEDGDWKIDYFYFNSRTGQSSRRRYDGLDADVPDTTTSTQHIVITNLPSTEARTNDVATSLRFEAKAPSSSVYRLVADASGVAIDVAIGTTTVTINSSNTFTLLGEYDDDVPPQHTAKLIAENRQFLIGNTTDPWRLYFSKINAGVTYYESFPSTNFRDFGRGDGDYTTALAFLSPRTLIVGFKNSIWALDARDPAVSDRVRIAKGVGIANHLSLIVQGNTIYFVSDADEHKGMFKWQPGMVEPEHLINIDDTFHSLSFGRLDNCSSIYYAPDNNRHQWWTTVATTSSDQDKILVYDTILDAWTDYDIVANVLGMVEETSTSEVYIGRVGFEAKADNGTTDATVAVAAKFKTKAYTFGMSGVRKKTRFIDYVAQRKTGSIAAMVETDFGAGTGSTATLNYPNLGAAFVLATDSLGATDRFLGGGSGDFNGREAVRALGRLIAYEFASQTDFHLKTVSYGIQKTGRR